MKEASNVVVLITTAIEEEAHSIAELLLNQRRGDCFETALHHHQINFR